jgi:hypothetical protein
MKWSLTSYFLVIFVKLLAQIEALLEVNFTAGQLLSDLKIASPGSTSL